MITALAADDGSPLDAAAAAELAGALKALADPARLRILSMLLASPDGQVCTVDLVEPLGLTQPTVTHHLRRLAEAGLVTGRRDGVWTFYAARPQVLQELAQALRPDHGPAPDPGR